MTGGASIARRGVAVVALGAALLGGCGGGEESPAPQRTQVVFGSSDWPESELLSVLFARASQGEGYATATLRGQDDTSARRVTADDILRSATVDGVFDAYPTYAASELAARTKQAPAGSDVDEVVAELRSRYSPQGLTVLDPSPAVDRNALAVTKETADRLDLRKTSDLASVSRQLILGAPADCDQSPQCEQGLHDTYGISFRRIVALDPGKPTVDALERGDVQVAEIGSTDGYVRAKGMVILEDDKHLGDGDNVVLVVRRRLADDDTARSLWQDVLDQLSSSDLAEMNKRIQSDGEGVDTVAEEWLKAHGFLS